MSGGLECRNSENAGSCFDYKVRFFCASPKRFPTAAPVMPFDSCTGITCSGHGKCKLDPTSVSMKGYFCSCERGYFQRDCDDTPLRMSIAHNVSECGGLALEHRPPGIQYVWCADALVNSTGYTDMELTILASPSASVTCQIESASNAKARAVRSMVVFPVGSPLGSTASLQVGGVKDLERELPSQFTITARCQSDDLRFDTVVQDSLTQPTSAFRSWREFCRRCRRTLGSRLQSLAATSEMKQLLRLGV